MVPRSKQILPPLPEETPRPRANTNFQTRPNKTSWKTHEKSHHPWSGSPRIRHNEQKVSQARHSKPHYTPTKQCLCSAQLNLNKKRQCFAKSAQAPNNRQTETRPPL